MIPQKGINFCEVRENIEGTICQPLRSGQDMTQGQFLSGV